MGKLGNYIKYLGKQIEEEIESSVEKELPHGEDVVYLDCGCDDGKKTVKRAKTISTKNVFGIEVEETRKIKAEEKGVKVYKDDLNKKWSFESESVDCITATEVIEHLVDVDNFVSEAKRVLRKSGLFILSTENLASWHNIFALMAGIQPYTGPYISRRFPIGHRPHAKYYKKDMNKTMYPHLNVMTTRSLMQLVKNYGFSIKKVHGIGYYPFPKPLSNILSRLDKYHASYTLVVCQKV